MALVSVMSMSKGWGGVGATGYPRLVPSGPACSRPSLILGFTGPPRRTPRRPRNHLSGCPGDRARSPRILTSLLRLPAPRGV